MLIPLVKKSDLWQPITFPSLRILTWKRERRKSNSDYICLRRTCNETANVVIETESRWLYRKVTKTTHCFPCRVWYFFILRARGLINDRHSGKTQCRQNTVITSSRHPWTPCQTNDCHAACKALLYRNL